MRRGGGGGKDAKDKQGASSMSTRAIATGALALGAVGTGIAYRKKIAKYIRTLRRKSSKAKLFGDNKHKHTKVKESDANVGESKSSMSTRALATGALAKELEPVVDPMGERKNPVVGPVVPKNKATKAREYLTYVNDLKWKPLHGMSSPVEDTMPDNTKQLNSFMKNPFKWMKRNKVTAIAYTALMTALVAVLANDDNRFQLVHEIDKIFEGPRDSLDFLYEFNTAMRKNRLQDFLEECYDRTLFNKAQTLFNKGQRNSVDIKEGVKEIVNTKNTITKIDIISVSGVHPRKALCVFYERDNALKAADVYYKGTSRKFMLVGIKLY